MTENTTHLAELIETERKKANARIAKLRKQAEAEQRKVDAKVVELFKGRHADAYEKLVAEARTALAAERAQRSLKARRAAVIAAPAEVDQHGEEGHHG